MKKCPVCQTEIAAADAFCGACGARLPPGAVVPSAGGTNLRCLRCAGPIQPGEQFCGACGAPVSGREPVAVDRPASVRNDSGRQAIGSKAWLILCLIGVATVLVGLGIGTTGVERIRGWLSNPVVQPAQPPKHSGPENPRLASAGSDGMVKVWDLATGREIFSFRGHADSIHSLASSPDGRLLLTGSKDGTARLWEATTGKPVGLPMSHQGEVRAVAFSPDGKRVLTGSKDKEARLWSVPECLLLVSIPHTASVDAVAFSPDGETVLTGNGDGVKMTRSGNGVKLWEAQTEQILGVAFSPDGQHLASAGQGRPFSPFGGVVTFWDAGPGEGSVIMNEGKATHSVAFSPDGKRLASGHDDNTARVCEPISFAGHTFSRRECLTLRGHSGPVLSVTYSPDGQRLGSASADQTVKVWDSTTGRELLTLHGHSGPVSSVVFVPGGK
jgi:WD40 repeat protein